MWNKKKKKKNEQTKQNRLIGIKTKGMVSRRERDGELGEKGGGEYSQQYCGNFTW